MVTNKERIKYVWEASYGFSIKIVPEYLSSVLGNVVK